jgi:hypothetical protein
MTELIGIGSCRARLLRSDVDGREDARLAGGSDIRSLCSACSMGGGVETVGLGVDEADVGVGGELPRNSEEDAGDDFLEL